MPQLIRTKQREYQPDQRRFTLPAKFLKILCLILLMFVQADLVIRSAWAQTSWDITPYKVSVWIALSKHPKLTQQLLEDISQTITSRAESAFGYAWDLKTSRLPESLRYEAIIQHAPISEAELTGANEEVMKQDKLFIVTVQIVHEDYHLTVREFDCQTRLWSPLNVRQVSQMSSVSHAAFQLVYQTFSPIVQIGKVAGKKVPVKPRAGQLVASDKSPILLRQGMILQPVIRRNDRRGDPRPNGIQVVPWTLLNVVEKTEDGYLCEIHSGMRSPLGGRRNIRTQQLALVIKPHAESTRLIVRSRDQQSRPLVGYDVLRRVDTEKKYHLIARTDRQGAVTIPVGESPFEVLYVRYGSQLLARLPIVPGYQSEVVAKVVDDEMRLEAEGFLLGFQDKLIDLVARRQILSARIKRRIKEKRFQQADKLLEQYRSLTTQSELSQQILIQRQRFVSNNSRLQNKLNKLFDATHRMIQSHLDPQEVSRLSKLLSNSRQGSVQ